MSAPAETPPPAPPATRLGALCARLFPPLTTAQAEILANVRFPCC